MKKAMIVLLFSIVYAILLGIGLVCLLNLADIFLAAVVFDASLVQEYPRFIPFCFLVGLFALVAIIALSVFNIKVSKKYIIIKKIWWAQLIAAILISIPMIVLWEMLFEFLQKTF